MNPILNDIYAQPGELARVLRSLTGEQAGEVRRVADLLNVADEIVLTSMGSAFYSLMPMYEALTALGRRATLIETADLIHYPEKRNPRAVYVLMSRSGESREVADFSGMLKRDGCMCVAITMTPDSTMAKNSTVMLYDIASYDDIVCIKAYSSMALCGLVCVSMMGKKEFDPALAGALYAAFDWMEQNKAAILAQYEAIPFLGEAHNFYLLSRGFGVNVMRSCSLWVEETAKTCANIMSIDNFYHGPMEVIRAAKITKAVTCPLFLDVFPDDRSRMIWKNVHENIPHCIYVGPEGEAPVGGACLSFPDWGLPCGYRMIPLALYFQILSYEVALRRGIEPGMFYSEGWVVT